MSAEWVIKLPLTEPVTASVLIHVTRKDGKGLDLDLLATDGDAAYRGKVRERSLKKLRSKNYDGSEEDWSAILQHVLVSKQSSTVSGIIKSNLEVVCSITGKDPKATLSITFRSRVEEITQRLGAIDLPQTDDTDDVDLFGWAGQAIDQRDKIEEEATLEKMKAEAASETITALQAQLADLVKAKGEHENELISKCVALLNEKKMRLRETARAMSVSKADKQRLDMVEATLGGAGKPPSTRGKKRPVAGAGGEDDSESEGFKAMEVDMPAIDEEVYDSDRRTTKSSSADETDSGDEADVDQPVTSQASGYGGPPKASTSEQATLPPPRILPFQKKGQGTTHQQTKSPPRERTGDDDDETASEDDEL